MTNFEETRSSLGFFWPQDNPKNRWPGNVFIDQFPTLRVFRIGDHADDKIPMWGELLVHGVTENNEYISMFDAWGEEASRPSDNEVRAETTRITSNYMLVGTRCFDRQPSVMRLKFSSYAVERVLNLRCSFEPAVSPQSRRKTIYRQFLSFMSIPHRIRVRVFKSMLPMPRAGGARSFLTINFLDAVAPEKALEVLHQFRMLLSFLCGEAIDLRSVELLHKLDGRYAHSRLYCFEKNEAINDRHHSACPIINVFANSNLFRRVISKWLCESECIKRCRVIFNSAIEDGGVLSNSQLRNLVTITEMRADGAHACPVPPQIAGDLRKKLVATLHEFARDHAESHEWLPVIEQRISNINYYSAKKKLESIIKMVPVELVSVPDAFAGDVIDLRNKLVHDVSRVADNDSRRLGFFVFKLQAICAVLDVLSLGAETHEINEWSDYIQDARGLIPYEGK